MSRAVIRKRAKILGRKSGSGFKAARGMAAKDADLVMQKMTVRKDGPSNGREADGKLAFGVHFRLLCIPILLPGFPSKHG